MGHGSEHGHGHGAPQAHAPSGAGHASSGDPHELPPAPAIRHITPAPEDFAVAPAPRRLLWPVFWTIVAVVLVLAVRAYGWHETVHHDAPGTTHGAPHAPTR